MAVWLKEDWYKEVVWFRLFGLTDDEKASSQLANRIRKKAANFRLVASKSASNSALNSNRKPRVVSLAFVKRNGLWSWSFRHSQVNTVLSLPR